MSRKTSLGKSPAGLAFRVAHCRHHLRPSSTANRGCSIIFPSLQPHSRRSMRDQARVSNSQGSVRCVVWAGVRARAFRQCQPGLPRVSRTMSAFVRMDGLISAATGARRQLRSSQFTTMKIEPARTSVNGVRSQSSWWRTAVGPRPIQALSLNPLQIGSPGPH